MAQPVANFTHLFLFQKLARPMREKVRGFFEVSAGRTRVGFASTVRDVAGKLEHLCLEQKLKSGYYEEASASASVVGAWMAYLRGYVEFDYESWAWTVTVDPHWRSAETERYFFACGDLPHSVRHDALLRVYSIPRRAVHNLVDVFARPLASQPT